MRRYDDQVEVRRRDEDPAEFRWRGRFYAVREVLAHWVETGAWWEPGSDRSPDAFGGEREVWRVAASPGRVPARVNGAGVYDLCFDWAVGGWTLLRVMD